MTEIKISCLDECIYMRKCDDDENKQGVKMAISSNDVQLILLCGCWALRSWKIYFLIFSFYGDLVKFRFFIHAI